MFFSKTLYRLRWLSSHSFQRNIKSYLAFLALSVFKLLLNMVKGWSSMDSGLFSNIIIYQFSYLRFSKAIHNWALSKTRFSSELSEPLIRMSLQIFKVQMRNNIFLSFRKLCFHAKHHHMAAIEFYGAFSVRQLTDACSNVQCCEYGDVNSNVVH
jgi:hypothetical protein